MPNKRISIFAAVAVVLLAFPGSGLAAAQQGAYTTATAAGQDPAADLSGKLDKTIQVLSVIKGELDTMKTAPGAPAASAVPGAPAQAAVVDEGWIDQMKGKVSALIRMWKKTDAIMNEDKSSAGSQAQVDEAAQSFNQKLDTAIKALEVLKEELKAAETDPAAKK